MKRTLLVTFSMLYLAACDAVFHRYMNIEGSHVSQERIQSVILEHANANQYDCNKISLPSREKAFNCTYGIVFEITEQKSFYVVRISTQTAFYEPSSYTKFHEGVSKVLKSELGNSNVTIIHN